MNRSKTKLTVPFISLQHIYRLCFLLHSLCLCLWLSHWMWISSFSCDTYIPFNCNLWLEDLYWQQVYGGVNWDLTGVIQHRPVTLSTVCMKATVDHNVKIISVLVVSVHACMYAASFTDQIVKHTLILYLCTYVRRERGECMPTPRLMGCCITEAPPICLVHTEHRSRFETHRGYNYLISSSLNSHTI